MTFVPVVHMDYPNLAQMNNANAGSATQDATGEKYAWIGALWWPDRTVTSRAIRKASFLFGTVVKAGGSALTFSLQNLDTTAGPPARPDGTQDQTFAIANGNAGFVTNSYFTTGNLSADRTVSLGERIAAVLEFDGAGRLGSDTFAVQHLTSSPWIDGPTQFTASWANLGASNGIVFEFADTTLSLLIPSAPMSDAGVQLALNTGTTPDEVALAFTPDFKCKVAGAWVGANTAGATSDFEVVLYQGTTPIRTATFDANAVRTTGYQLVPVNFEEIELTPGTTYYLSVKPTTANNVSVRYLQATSNAVLDMWEGGLQGVWAQRTDAGAWTINDTRKPWMGLRISAVDDGSGGGGGGNSAGNILGGSIVR